MPALIATRPTPTLRRATDADVPALVAMQRHGWLVDYRGRVSEAEAARSLTLYGDLDVIRTHIDRYRFYTVADVGGDVLGVVCGDDDPADPTRAEIYWIHVAHAGRNLGLGRALIQHVIDTLPLQVTTLDVVTFQDYTPTIAFYERVGFAAVAYTATQTPDGSPLREVRLRATLPSRNPSPTA